MKRSLIAGLVSVMTFVALPLYGAGHYRVIVRLDAGEDAAALARRLAATYGGALERPAEVDGDRFTMSVTLGPRQAELLARDPFASISGAISAYLGAEEHSAAKLYYLQILCKQVGCLGEKP